MLESHALALKCLDAFDDYRRRDAFLLDSINARRARRGQSTMTSGEVVEEARKIKEVADESQRYDGSISCAD
jgi:hypothetical protein